MAKHWVQAVKPAVETALDLWTRVPKSEAWKWLKQSGLIERWPQARAAVMGVVDRRGVTPWGALAGAFAAGAAFGAGSALLFAPADGVTTRGKTSKWATDLLARLREETSSSRATSGAPTSLGALSKQELYERARDKNVVGRSQMDKEGLVEALRAEGELS